MYQLQFNINNEYKFNKYLELYINNYKNNKRKIINNFYIDTDFILCNNYQVSLEINNYWNKKTLENKLPYDLINNIFTYL